MFLLPTILKYNKRNRGKKYISIKEIIHDSRLETFVIANNQDGAIIQFYK